MEEFRLLTDIAVALAAALVGGLGARLLRVPAIAGYLVAGALVGPFTPGYVAGGETVGELAELGVIFLMFGVGLHFNLRDLYAVRKIAVPGALLQMAAATLMGVGIGHLFDLPFREALVLGLAFSVASTVVLVRALEEYGLLESIHARVAIGWLIVEDLATVLVLVLLPSLESGRNGDVLLEAAGGLAAAAVFVGFMLLAGAWLVPKVLVLIAKTGSRELFILGIVTIALGIATGGAVAGLSVALGAFIAGVVVSETETSHQAAADVLPLRQAFAVLFFVSVGMLVDPKVLGENLGLLFALLVAIVVGKAVVAAVIVAAFPYPARTGLTVAAGLAQTGEFTFIIALEALDLGIMSHSTYTVLLAASAISITLNPLAFRMILPAERFLKRTPPLWDLLNRQGPPPSPVVRLRDHVVVVGYGRVGRFTVNALARLGVRTVIVEVDMDLTRELAAAGMSTVWGDAANEEVLKEAHLDQARLLVVAVPDESTTLLAVAGARRLNASIPIVVRARTGEEIPRLTAAGAQEVVVPEYEGGLALMRQTLSALGVSEEDATEYAHVLRDTYYGPVIPGAYLSRAPSPPARVMGHALRGDGFSGDGSEQI